MKKLNKFQINSEKLMKNEELLNLKGGYGGACCLCYYPLMHMLGATGPANCRELCKYAGFDGGRWDC
jgi:hypothetical protein